MGLVYSKSEAHQFIEAMTSNIRSGTNVTNDLKAGCEHLIRAVDGKTLSGAAYNAGKGLFSELILPTITRVSQAIDEMNGDLTRFSGANRSMQEASTNTLDEDKLNAKIQETEGYRDMLSMTAGALESQAFDILAMTNPVTAMLSLANQLFDIQGQLNRQVESVEQDLEKLKKDLRLLQDFGSQTQGLFENSLNNFKLAMQGVLVLNNMKVNSDGTYSFPKGMDKSWYTSQKSDKEIQSSMSYVLSHIPENMTSEETESWILEQIEKYGPDFLNELKSKNSLAKKSYKIIDAALKFKNGKAFLNGVQITQDAAGRLKWGNKFLSSPKGFAYNNGKAFKDASGIDLTSYGYSKLPNGKIDLNKVSNLGMSKFKDSAKVWNDFKGWKNASTFGKFGKGMGVISTAFTVGGNAQKYFGDGIQGNDVVDFATDTAIDIGSGAGTAALGAMVGSAFLPPLGTVVGAGVGLAANWAINEPFGTPPKSAVQHVKDGVKTVTKEVGKGIKEVGKSVGNFFSGAVKWAFGG